MILSIWRSHRRIGAQNCKGFALAIIVHNSLLRSVGVVHWQLQVARTVNRERVTLRQVIEAGSIETPVDLRTTYRDQIFNAQLLPNGTIEFEGSLFDAPSMALGAARNLAEGRALGDPMKPTGGWPYWH